MTSVERIFENLDEDIIIKPSRGGRGLGIIKVQAREREEAISSLQKISRQGNVFVIQKKLKQSGFCHKVNPQAVNTIRILTMRDPDKGEPFIAQAVQRFGSESTGYLDNWSAGGLSVDIDLDKGVYKKGATRSSMKGLNWLSRHPDSDIKFEGIAVENWEEIKKGVLELSKELFFIPYIGWDIVPFKNGFRVLEANYNTDVDLLQIHQPLLKNPRIRKFYEINDLITS